MITVEKRGKREDNAKIDCKTKARKTTINPSKYATKISRTLLSTKNFNSKQETCAPLFLLPLFDIFE